MLYEDRLKEIKKKHWQLSKEIFKIIVFTLVSGGGTRQHPILHIAIGEIIKLLKEKKQVSFEKKK